MKLFVNSEEVEVQLEGEKTIGDLLRSFEEICSKNLMTTIGVAIDKKQISQNDFDSILPLPLKENTRIDLDVMSCSYLEQNFKTLAGQLEDLAKQLEGVAGLLQTQPQQVQQIIKTLTDRVDFLCHLTTYSSLFPQKYGSLKIEEKTFAEFFKDFSCVLRDFEQALKTGDTVTVGDLAEYEIAPRLLSVCTSLKSL